MEIKIDTQNLVNGNINWLKESIKIKMTFKPPIESHNSELLLSEFVWFISLFTNPEFNKHSIGHRSGRFGGLNKIRRINKKYSWISRNSNYEDLQRIFRSHQVSLVSIKKESPLEITLLIQSLSLILFFIQVIVQIYGKEKAQDFINKYLKLIQSKLKDSKSIFIIEDDNNKNGLEDSHEKENDNYETLDLNQLKKEYNPPYWAEIIEIEIESNIGEKEKY